MERPLYSEIVDGAQRPQMAAPQLQERLFANHASTSPDLRAGGAPTWGARNPLATDFTLKSGELQGGGVSLRGADGAAAGEADPYEGSERTKLLHNSMNNSMKQSAANAQSNQVFIAPTQTAMLNINPNLNVNTSAREGFSPRHGSFPHQ